VREKEKRALKDIMKQMSLLLKDIAYEEDYVNSSDLCDLWVLVKKVEQGIEINPEGCQRGWRSMDSS